ncbi:uncharacterized protein LOC107882452 [Acyrthosiphon pisum]|uniref:Reverse transcriptase domain-containing protein n=1 Tax=Acyrthosiphon pisum TaxID=7029 RepID=A0A8R2H5E2_ACYPI|nr:uncharacterized protein LOC107882452 [Acyrthosiphon pisum]|eukprot:XP_016656285.1 PREDICTED: uncharacterized protein LOC107882452 [Acyrthosiphon pisum]
MDGTCFSLLAYADDIVLLGEEEQKVVDLGDRLIEAAKKVGLHINMEKTQYMKISRELDNFPETETITVDQYDFKKVEDFKYLGTIVTQKNECQIDIQQRIKMRNKCFFLNIALSLKISNIKYLNLLTY